MTVLRYMLALASLARTASAQVAMTVRLDASGSGATMTSNPSSVSYHVSAVLRTQHLRTDGSVEIDSVTVPGALVSPAHFDLAPGEQQAIRVRIPIKGLPSGTILRLMTTFDPVTPPAEHSQGVSVSLATRYVFGGKLLVP